MGFIMEENVKKEVETLKQMMRNWRRGFLTWHEPGVENDYILQEFHEEITDQLMPYVGRLMHSEHLTCEEARKVMDDCYAEVEKLKKDLEVLDNE